MNEKEHLRKLAEKYAEYAMSETMAQRREKWRLNNRMEAKTFPFHIEDNGTYLRDLKPALQCEEEDCRNLELRLIHALTSYEKIDDDRIIPDRFVVDWITPTTGWCDELELTHADDGAGGSFGFESNEPIKNIDEDFHKLSQRTMTLDREWTEKRAELTREIFKGLLPVVIGRPSSHYSDGISNKAVHLMGMQELYLQMALEPEAVHRLLTFLAEDNLALGQWEEDQQLLTINNDGNQGYCSGSCQFSDEITVSDPVRSAERFGYLESQESVGLSPDMFNEFLMPHFLKLSAKFKLMKFGCCEPVHDWMPHLQKMESLRKVSVTPWCDIRKLTETCNKDIIWSRKPTPLKLCGDKFDPEEFRAHLQETLDIGKDFFIEFVFRDTNRLTGDMEQRLVEACGIVREITEGETGSKA